LDYIGLSQFGDMAVTALIEGRGWFVLGAL